MSIFAAVPFIPRKITHRGGCSYTSAALTFGRPRPNALGKTIWIRHGSCFRLGEKAGTVASALVLRRDAQNVRKRSDAGESADAFARAGVGRRRHGSRSRPQMTCLIALHSIGKSARRGARRLPILNRRQF